MTLADKAGILLAIGITAIAVAFAATAGTGLYVVETSEKRSDFLEKEMHLEMQIAKKGTEEMKKTIEQTEEEVKQALKEAKEKTEKATASTGDVISSKLPAKLVSIPAGTSVPGCEEAGLCYDPAKVTIFVGGEIIWRNDDSSPHTVTSGIALTGPDGNFDSGLILGGETFSNKFEKTGDYRYFCMIHPWAEGLVSVR